MSPVHQVSKPPTHPNDHNKTVPTRKSEPSQAIDLSNTFFAPLDCLQIFMQPGMGSYRVEMDGPEFMDKAFVRITPPRKRAPGRKPKGVKTKIEWERNPYLKEWKVPSKRSFRFVDNQEDFSKVITCNVYEQITAGKTWDVFRGMIMLDDRSVPLQPVVLKLTKFKSFNLPDEEHNPQNGPFFAEDEELNRIDAIHQVLNEDFILRQYLVGLQGTVVPIYYGMFVWHEEHEENDNEVKNWIIATIMEDVGDPIYPVMSLYPLPVKDQILECYNAIHDQSQVVHNHTASKHILERDNVNKENIEIGRFCLIDFKEAVSMAELQSTESENMIDSEDAVIRYCLNI